MLRFAQPEERKPDVLLATTPSGDTVFLGDDAGIPSHHYPLSDIPERAYIFTDRPLYRPGDRVQGKAIPFTTMMLITSPLRSNFFFYCLRFPRERNSH